MTVNLKKNFSYIQIVKWLAQLHNLRAHFYIQNFIRILCLHSNLFFPGPRVRYFSGQLFDNNTSISKLQGIFETFFLVFR